MTFSRCIVSLCCTVNVLESRNGDTKIMMVKEIDFSGAKKLSSCLSMCSVRLFGKDVLNGMR